RRGKRMVRWIPAPLAFVPFEHWKVGDPNETIVVRVAFSLEGSMAVFIFLRQRETELSRSGVNRGRCIACLNRRAVFSRSAAHYDQQILLSSAGLLSDLCHCIRE